MFHPGIERMLQQAMGLDSASIGSSAIERAVKHRLSCRESDDLHAYWEFVRESTTELQALIEAVIVPETWFFRDHASFTGLASISKEEGKPGHVPGVLRLLSLPCSSGEEPYSMAMVLLDAGLSGNRFRIDAVDISAVGLSRARCAEYGKNSFRNTDLTFRDRYFESTASGWRLSEAVCEQVRFQQGNLLEEDLLPGAEIYDIIFCRNLLIYFDRGTQERSVQVLKRLLKPKGVLFVGPSEGSVLLKHGFVSRNVPSAFVSRRSGLRLYATVRMPSKAKSKPPLGEHRETATRLSSAAEPCALNESALDEAVGLADQGRMAEAAESCEGYLLKHGPSAPSLFLMGLIRAAAGNTTEARRYYRKALYLDRSHHGALIHLRLLLEKQGDAAGAKVIGDRLQRLLQNGVV